MKENIKLKSPTKKETILKIIYDLYKEADAGYVNHMSDRYYLGRYKAMLDILNEVKIFEE